MKDGQHLKIGDAHVTPKKYPRSTSVRAWGCPRHPLLHQQYYHVTFQDTIFLFLHMICVIIGASFYFSFSLFCLLAGNKWLDPSILVWRETHSVFIVQNTLVLTLIFLWVFSFCYYCVQLQFFTRILFRACWFAYYIYDQLSGLK